MLFSIEEVEALRKVEELEEPTKRTSNLVPLSSNIPI